jgi:hypothetical protein
MGAFKEIMIAMEEYAEKKHGVVKPLIDIFVLDTGKKGKCIKADNGTFDCTLPHDDDMVPIAGVTKLDLSMMETTSPRRGEMVLEPLVASNVAMVCAVAPLPKGGKVLICKDTLDPGRWK